MTQPTQQQPQQKPYNNPGASPRSDKQGAEFRPGHPAEANPRQKSAEEEDDKNCASRDEEESPR